MLAALNFKVQEVDAHDFGGTAALGAGIKGIVEPHDLHQAARSKLARHAHLFVINIRLKGLTSDRSMHTRFLQHMHSPLAHFVYIDILYTSKPSQTNLGGPKASVADARQANFAKHSP